MKNITIRKALVSDAQALIAFCNIVGGESNFLTYGLNNFPVSLEEEKKFLSTTIDSEKNLSLVAISKNKIIGLLNFRNIPKERLSHVGEFGISILKEFWGNGIAKRMIKEMENWVIQNNTIKKINLQVHENNEKAIELYKKCGYSYEGRLTKNIFLNGNYFDSIIMGKFLEGSHIHFKKIETLTETKEILNLVLDSFNAFVAPDYSKEGIDTFYNFLNNGEIFKKAIENNENLIIAYSNDKPVGAILSREKSHISLLFVDKNYQNKGIAKKLFSIFRENTSSEKITVNSSPFAVKIYEKLGFSAISTMQETHGIKSVPMEFKNIIHF